MIDYILNGIAFLKMQWIKIFLWQPLIKKTHLPQVAQNKLLLRILKENSRTRYGEEHGFSKINSYKDYQKAVPVNSYEALEKYILQQEIDKQPYLNTEQPLIYAQTSGTTAKPKFIPILKKTVSQYRKSQHIVAYAKYIAIPGVFRGKVLAIVSPAEEGRMETGTPYGSMSGLIYKSMPTFVRKKYVVPANVFEITNYEQKYYLITRYALIEKNISMIATANPSTLLKIKEILDKQSLVLIEDIRKSNSSRADELQEFLSNKNALKFAEIWPNLKSVTVWTSGSCAALIPSLRKNFSANTRIVEMGYLSSEFRGGITVDVINNLQIPAIHETFFEFIEKKDYESKIPEFLTLEKIEVGKQYYIYATTQNGLFRYDINDIIEVTGRFNKTPTIRFVQKGKGVTNLTGEKLYEAQLMMAMAEVSKTQGVNMQFFVMLACPDTLKYSLYIESDPVSISVIEQQLCDLNIEFEAKRKSGRLKPLEVIFLKEGTAEFYKQHSLKTGQREAQYKLMHLQYKQDCTFDFSLYKRE